MVLHGPESRPDFRIVRCNLKDSQWSQGTFHSALLSWRYPQCPLPPSLANALGGIDGGNDFLIARHNSWQESFRNLFLSLRSKACAAFYCIAPEVRALQRFKISM